MSEQLVGILIPAIAVIVSALIAAVAGAGKGRDAAVLLALIERDAEIRRLADELQELREDEEDGHHGHRHG